MPGPGLGQRASIELGEPLSRQPSSKGQHSGVGNSGPYVRLMRPDFLDLLSPSEDASSPPLFPDYRRGFGRMRDDVSRTTLCRRIIGTLDP